MSNEAIIETEPRREASSKATRFILASGLASLLIGAAEPETRVAVTLQPDLAEDALMERLHAIREKAWPNLRILEMGDAMLGRGGTLPAAAAPLYRHQLQLRPHLADVMRNAGRGREVDAGQAAG